MNGVNFNALEENDTVAIEGNILKITLGSPLSGDNNHIKIEAETLTNENGDSLNGEIIAKVPALEGCFIATAAYGSYLDSHVWVLRQFRDNVLLESTLGRWFVAEYYRNSPPIAAYIAQHESLQAITRLLLTPLILAYEFPAAGVFTLFILIMGMMILKSRQKRLKKLA